MSRHPLHDASDEAAEVIMFTLEALAGRLLPEGGTERTEWRVTSIYASGRRADCVFGDEFTARHFYTVSTIAVDRELHSRTVTDYPNGSVLTGAWVEVLNGPEGEANG